MIFDKYVLNLLKDVSEDARIVALIRHSKRPSFQGIPDHLRDAVEITPEGIRMAREFGASLRQISPNKRIFLSYNSVKRCEMTARAIREGYSSAILSTDLGYAPELITPIIDMNTYIALREELGYSQVMKNWMEGNISPGILWDPDQYAEKILKTVLNYPVIRSGDMLIIVTQDIAVFPLISSWLGKIVTSLDFLNGVVISADTTKADILFQDADHKLKITR